MKQSMIHLDYPLCHPGVERAEKVVSNFKSMGQSFNATRTVAAMLLAAVASTFFVVADQMIDTWAEGHLLAAWVALWAIVFAALGLFAGVIKTAWTQLRTGLDALAVKMAQRRSDARLWSIAQTDTRLMSELQIAMTRSDDESELNGGDKQSRIARMMRQRQKYC